MWMLNFILYFILTIVLSVAVAIFIDAGLGLGLLILWLSYMWAEYIFGLLIPLLVALMVLDIVIVHASLQTRGTWVSFSKWYHIAIEPNYPGFDRHFKRGKYYVSLATNMPGVHYLLSLPRAGADFLVNWTTWRNTLVQRVYRVPIEKLGKDAFTALSTAVSNGSASQQQQHGLRQRTSVSSTPATILGNTSTFNPYAGTTDSFVPLPPSQTQAATTTTLLQPSLI